MKDPFRGLTIGFTGDFGDAKSHKNIQRWIQLNGGTPTQEVDEYTTHLLCTPEDWEKKAPQVRRARRLNDVFIVVFDWLEDSLIRKRPLRETPYLLAKLQKEKNKLLRKKLDAKKAAIRRFHQGCTGADEDILSNRHHIYRDETLFEYSIVLVRADLDTNRIERHYLKLYESHARPYLYGLSAKYTRPGISGKLILAPPGSYFEHAFREFRRYFKEKTGMAWEVRLDGRPAVPGQFAYCPPGGGKPRGIMPAGWREPGPVPDRTYSGASRG
ncbi:MAG: hypothetical protein M4579_005310 [Chaenotheca gracillima]|nr:MAG: hypothetical protein M4579_005310 [Chaenotheca gracillima]